MKTLGASIVQRGIATVGDVEEALARQVMYGGDLATNLLELASVSEGELTELLAQSHGLRPAPRGELPSSPEGVRRLVPGDLAFRHGLYPLAEEAGTLTVAVAEPLAREVDQDLSFALGVSIVQLAAPLVRIRQALARDYLQPLDKRTARILTKLTGQPASLSEPPRVDLSALPRHETLPPSVYARDDSVDLEAATAPPPEVYPILDPNTQKLVTPTNQDAGSESRSAPSFTTEDAAPEPRVADEPRGQARVTTAPPTLEGAQALRTAARAIAQRSKQDDDKPHRRLGPYTAADAERDLMGADDRDDVLNAFFDFAAQYFEYCALFVMHGDLAEGRDARGPGASPELVRALGIPLDLPSAIATVYERGKWQLVRLTGGGIDVGLAKDLKRESGPQCLLLPIIMRKRCVLILYGDHGEGDVRLSDVGDVISFAPLVASGLERVILKRKRAMHNDVLVSRGVPLPSSPPRRSHAPLPPIAVRAQALVGVLGSGSNPPPAPRPSDPPPAPSAGGETLPPSATPTRLSPMPPAPDASAPEAAEVAPRTHQYGDAPFARSARSKTYSGLGPAGAERPLTLDFNRTPHAEPALDAPTDPDTEEEIQRTSVVPQRVVSIGAAAPAAEPAATAYDSSELSRTQMSPRDQGLAAPATAPLPSNPGTFEAGWVSDSPPRRSALTEAATTSPISPDIHVGEADLDRDVLDAIARDERAPLAPASRSIAYSARPPSRRQSSEELRLPSVIVDFESDSRALVHRLCAGDHEAGEKLVEMGTAAVSALVAEFPGPITQPLSRGSQESLQRASECGPLLKTLARIGAPAVPFLVVRTADTQPFVRGWATRLLGELPNRDSGVAVARRLVDDNQDVRRAALAAARMLQRDPVARAAIREYIADLARDRSRSNEARHAALEALSDVRDAEAVPVFIQMLEDPNRELAKSARWGLTVLTRTDLGDKAYEWEKWWRKNAGRHRIEWLIDSLMHDDAEIRRAAGDELKSITKEYFGYYDDLPRRERAGAQARYREWWEGKGKSRFALN